MLNIYLVTQDACNYFDSYDSFVAIAESTLKAKQLHPMGNGKLLTVTEKHSTWPGLDNIDKIYVTLIGVAAKGQKVGVVLASYNQS